MNLIQFKSLFYTSLGDNYKTKQLDLFNKSLIKSKTEVNFLKPFVLTEQQYHRTYFQVSIGLLNSIEQKLDFIEENFYNLQDWWHVDQLQQFVDKQLTFDIAFKRAVEYINHEHPFARRWAYVMFMPTLVKNEQHFEKIISLFKEDNHYYVIMAQAWLISYLAIYFPEKTLEYLSKKPLSYNIVGKAIQKTCDSFRVSEENKQKFKLLRNLYKQ